MTDLRTAAQQALEALEGWENHDRWVWPESALEQAKRNTTEALAALRTALAEPVQEPVAGRAAFERHAERLGYSVDPDTREGREGGYWSSHTQLMWLTWQAALAEPVQEPAQKVAAERKRLLSLAKRRADHEASAAAHHAGRWHAAHEYHLTRHAAMRDLIALLAEPQEPVSGPT